MEDYSFLFHQPLRAESNGVYFSPSLGAAYAVSSETSVFARTSLSYKPQGFTAYSDNAATTEFDEEQSLETEIGVSVIKVPINQLVRSCVVTLSRSDDYQLNQSVTNGHGFHYR